MKNIWIFMAFCLLISLLWSCRGSKKVTKPKRPILEKPTVVTPLPKKMKIPTSKEAMEKTTEQPLVLDTPTVKRLQILLYLAGYSPGRVNGTLQQATKDAAFAFNKDINLLTDSLSQETLKAIGVPLVDFEIEDLQTALEAKQYDPGPVDNLIGPMTKGAYVKFLTQHNFPKKLFTKATKEALFGNDPIFNNKEEQDNLFFEEKTVSKIGLPNEPLNIQQANLQSIQRALLAQGYDPGPTSEEMTPQLKDALFKYQVDKKLPIGGLNTDTLKALGFR